MEIICIEENNKKYIEEIIKLEEEVFGKNGAIDYWNLKPLIKYGKVYALIVENELLACAEIMKKWDGRTVYLYGLAVKKGYSGKGYGYKILEKILQDIQLEKIENIELTVSQLNLNAIKLYEKFGFKRIKFLKDEYGKNIDRILYKKIKY